MGSTAQIVRVAPGVHWHALEDDVVVGRGHALHRADGRAFISVDTWADDVFAALAQVMIEDLRSVLFTVVADDDREHLGRWSLAGFRDNRREDEYSVPIAVNLSGPGQPGLTQRLIGIGSPPGYDIVRADRVDQERLRRLDEQVRQDVPGYAGWVNTSAEFHRWTLGNRFFDPSTSLVAVQHEEYVGLIRILSLPRQPRLSLIGVLPDHRRRGVARALLAAAFQPLIERGSLTVFAEADESNLAGRALLAGLGAIRIGGAIELIRSPG